MVTYHTETPNQSHFSTTKLQPAFIIHEQSVCMCCLSLSHTCMHAHTHWNWQWL